MNKINIIAGFLWMNSSQTKGLRGREIKMGGCQGNLGAFYSIATL